MSKIIFNDIAYGEFGSMGGGGLGGGVVELTQAEYDGLTIEEKEDDVLYLITDGTPDKIIVNDPAPIGSIQAYGGSTAPDGWLFCQGQAISRLLYSELFAVIGTLYGEGDGTTTFNLPDLQGRVTMGAGTLDNNTYTLGEQKDAGLPNISGSMSERSTNYNTGNITWSAVNSLFTVTTHSGNTADSLSQVNGAVERKLITFDASKVNSIYGNSTTVQPPATITNYIIKAKENDFSNSRVLPMLDFFYPIGSCYETKNSTFNPNISWGGTWELEPIRDKINASGEQTVTAAQNYTLCSITLEPNTKYMVFGNVTTNNGTEITIMCNLNTSDAVIYQLGDVARVTTSAGQGVTTWRYIETGENTATVNCLSYGYYTTSHIERGKIIAIPLNKTTNYKWHRTA